MYREPAPRDPAEEPPRELRYDAMDDGASRVDGMNALFRHVSLPLLGAAAIAWLAGPLVGATALVGAGGFSVWSWRTRKQRGGAVLRVEGSVLAVEIRDARALCDRFRLSDLADVVLDVKTIERVTDGPGALPALRFATSKVGPKVDIARIVLHGTNGRELPLTTDYLPHMHATEWLGKIRAFLRKHGWVPEDERESPASEEKDETTR